MQLPLRSWIAVVESFFEWAAPPSKSKKSRSRRQSRASIVEQLEPRWVMSLTADPLGVASPTTGASLIGNSVSFPGQTTQIRQAPGADGGNPSVAATAPDGMVQYGTGVVQLSAAPALDSDVGVKFGITLLWSNQVAAALGPAGNPTLGSNRFGNGVSAAEIPQLIQGGSIVFTSGVGSVSPTSEGTGEADSVIAIDGSVTDTFNYSTGSYSAQGFSLDKLTYDESSDHYFLVDTAGDIIEFHGFKSTTLAQERGQLIYIRDSAGNLAHAIYDDGSTGRLEEIDLYASGGSTPVDEYVFHYDSSVSTSLVSDVELKRSVSGTMTRVQQLACTYYNTSGTGANAFGNAGDLMTAQIEDGTGGSTVAAGNVLNTTYFRYDTGSGTFQHGLLEFFSNAAFARLAAKAGSGSDPKATDDSIARAYADVQLNYGGPNGAWVTGLTTSMGGVSYDYSINALSGYSDAFANWKVLTTESAIDGGHLKTYTNFAGETLLQDAFVPSTAYSSSGQDLDTAYQYNTSGRLLQTDLPSAVSTYSDSYNNLNVQLVTSGGGLIQLIDYYGSTDYSPTTITTTTTSTSNVGGVQGYVKDDALKNATTSAVAIQDYLQYNNVAASITVDGFSITDALAPVARTTVYTDENSSVSGATGAEETDYALVFNPSTVSVASVTATLPTVSDQDTLSTNVHNVFTSIFDLQGHTAWTMDARGIIGFMAHDLATGALTTGVQDVSNSQLGNNNVPSSLPSGWSFASGTRANLLTTIGIDSLGRAVQVIDPNLAASFYVYRDDLREVRQYTGWRSNTARTSFTKPTGETLPPTQVAVDDLGFTATIGGNVVGESYSEQFSMAATPNTDSTTGAPLGTETVSDVTSLSLAITNKSGQQVETDAYYSIPSISGHLSTDEMVLYAVSSGAPLGTLWTTSTSDPSDANYYATDYTFGVDQNNVIDPNGVTTTKTLDDLGQLKSVTVAGNIIAEYQYDADGNITQTTEHTGSSSAPDRTVQYMYDFRDRRIAEKDGVYLNSSGNVDSTTLSAESADTTTKLPITFYLLNNLNLVTEVDTYAGNGYALSSVSSSGISGHPTGDTLLRSKVTYAYDGENREESMSAYDIAQSGSGAGTGTSHHDTSWLYDGMDDITQSTNPLGYATTWTFDGVGRPTAQTLPDPDGSGSLTSPVTHYGYTGTLPTSLQDANGNTTTYGYDAALRLDEIDEPTVSVLQSGATSTSSLPSIAPKYTYSYGDDGYLDSITDPNGNQASTTYSTTVNHDALGRKTSIVAPPVDVLASGSSNTTSASSSNPTQYFTYDGDSNVASVEDADGSYTAFSYNVFGQTTGVFFPDRTSGTAPTTASETWSYDNLGDLLSFIDARDNETDYSYNTLAQNTQIKQPEITALQSGATSTISEYPTTTFSYDVFGFTASITSPNANYSGGYSTQFSHNSFGNLTSVVQPNPTGSGTGLTTSYAYDADNELLTVTDPLSNVTTLGYDHAGRETSVKLPNPSTGSGSGGPTYTYAYYAGGQLKTLTDPFSNVTTYNLDARNQVSSVQLPNLTTGGTSGDPVITFYHDANGNQTAETDPDSNTTFSSFDALNRLASTSETVALYLNSDGTEHDTSSPATTSYLYDSAGNLTRTTDADGRVIDYSVDHQNQRTQEQWYDTTGTLLNTIGYDYYDTGELHDATDTYASATSQNSGYTYQINALGSVIQVDNNGGSTSGTPGVPDVQLNSQYDLNGNRTALTAKVDALGGSGLVDDFQNSYAYDALNRETSVVQTSKTGGYAVGYKKTTFGYDNGSRLTSLTDYKDSTNQAATGGFSYDHDSRITALNWQGLGGGYGGSYGYFEEMSWTYDSDSRVASFSNAVHSSENLTFTYDHDNQLTSAAAPYGGYGGLGGGSYGWDGNGDTTLSGHIAGKGNRLLSDGTYKYVYDAAGNLIQRYTSTAETDYTYDNRNRLVTVKDYTKGGGTLTQTQEVDLWYDMFDRLIGRTLTPYSGGSPVTGSAVTARFVYDGGGPSTSSGQAVLAFNGNESLTDRYLWGPAVDQILADERFSPSTSNWMPSSAGTVYWALTDNEGSVRDWISYGSLADHIVYDSFGKIVSQSSTSVPFAFMHNGVFYDPNIGLEYHNDPGSGAPGRWYNPAIQRWMSEDPLGLGPDPDPYRYNLNSPTNFTDPSGHDVAYEGNGLSYVNEVEQAGLQEMEFEQWYKETDGGTRPPPLTAGFADSMRNYLQNMADAAVAAAYGAYCRELNKQYIAQRDDDMSLARMMASWEAGRADREAGKHGVFEGFWRDWRYYANPLISHKSTSTTDNVLQWGTRVGQALALIGVAGLSIAGGAALLPEAAEVAGGETLVSGTSSTAIDWADVQLVEEVETDVLGFPIEPPPPEMYGPPIPPEWEVDLDAFSSGSGSSTVEL